MMCRINVIRPLFWACSLVVLAGCEKQSAVQGRYLDSQSSCRHEAETSVAQQPNVAAMNNEQQRAEVINSYVHCMNVAGWHIANPLKLKPTKDGPDAGKVAATPQAAPTAPVIVPAPATTPGPVTAGGTAAPTPPPARYQPSTVPDTPESSAGRQF